MDYSEADLLKLKEALLSGATSISVAGRTITFRSQNDLLTLIEQVKAALAAQSPAPTVNPNKITATFKK